MNINEKDIKDYSIQRYGDDTFLFAQQREGFIEGFKKALSILNEKTVNEANREICDRCQELKSFELGMTCPKCGRPFRSIKQI